MAEKNSLWKNIRANKGSGKKPTLEMLRQERKIKAKQYAEGSFVGEDDKVVTHVKSADDPAYRNYVIQKRLSDFSKLPYTHKDYLLSEDNFKTILTNDNSLANLPNNEWEKFLNPTFDEDHYMYNESLNDSTEGSYGSKVIYNDTIFPPTDVSYSSTYDVIDYPYNNPKLATAKYSYEPDSVDYDMPTFLKNHKPTKYHTRDSYQDIISTWYALNDKGTKYIKPITDEIENYTNLAELQKIYPKLTQEELNNTVNLETENPSYITNTLDKDGDNKHDYYFNFPGKKNDVNYLAGKGRYYPEEIQNEINRRLSFIPEWDEPTDYVVVDPELEELKRKGITNIPIQEEPLTLTSKEQQSSYKMPEKKIVMFNQRNNPTWGVNPDDPGKEYNLGDKTGWHPYPQGEYINKYNSNGKVIEEKYPSYLDYLKQNSDEYNIQGEYKEGGPVGEDENGIPYRPLSMPMEGYGWTDQSNLVSVNEQGLPYKNLKEFEVSASAKNKSNKVTPKQQDKPNLRVGNSLYMPYDTSDYSEPKYVAERDASSTKVTPAMSTKPEKDITPGGLSLQDLSIITDVMQLGNFVPHPAGQFIGKVGSWGSAALNGVQAYDAYDQGNYGDMAVNIASAGLGAYLGGKGRGYTRDMSNTVPGSMADRIASLGSRSGTYRPLTATPNLRNNAVIKRALNYNKGLLGLSGAEIIYDSKAEGGFYPTQGPPKALFKGYADGGYMYPDGGKTGKNKNTAKKPKPTIVYTDPNLFKIAQQQYQDSLDTYNLSRKVSFDSRNLPKIDKNKYDEIVKKDEAIDPKTWHFDKAGYDKDAKKGKAKEFKDYMYEIPSMVSRPISSLEEYEDKLRIDYPQYNENYPKKYKDEEIVEKLKNGVERHYQTYQGELDKDNYIDVYPNGTQRYNFYGDLNWITSPTIKPIDTEYYGKDVPEEINIYDMSSSSTGWYDPSGAKPKFKNKSNQRFSDLHVPHWRRDIYKEPTVRPVFKKSADKPNTPIVNRTPVQIDRLEPKTITNIPTQETPLELNLKTPPTPKPEKQTVMLHQRNQPAWGVRPENDPNQNYIGGAGLEYNLGDKTGWHDVPQGPYISNGVTHNSYVDYLKANPDLYDVQGGFAQGGYLYPGGGYTLPNGVDPIKPTRSDSLMLFNNALEKIKFYKNNPDYKRVVLDKNLKEPGNTILHTNFKDPAQRRTLITEGTFYPRKKVTQNHIDYVTKAALKSKPLTPLETARLKLQLNKNKFGKVPNTNLTSFGDILFGGSDDIYNPLAPPIYLHPNITPQGSETYDSNRWSDSTDIPYYDPIAVAPFDILTPEQQEKRIEKYGDVGVPQSYINARKNKNKRNTSSNTNTSNTSVINLPINTHTPRTPVQLENLESLKLANLPIQEAPLELNLKAPAKRKAAINRGANSSFDADGNPLVSEVNFGDGTGWHKVPYNTLDQYEEIKAHGGYTNPYNQYQDDPYLNYADGGYMYARGGGLGKEIAAGAYGALEGLVDTTFGWIPGVDMATDFIYKGLQKVGKSTPDQIRKQNAAHGFAQTAGAVGSAILTGGATTAGAISEGAQGIGQGIAASNQSKDWAEGAEKIIGGLGSGVGLVYGNTGSAKNATSAFKATEAGSQGLGKFAAASPIKGFSAAPKGTMQGVIDGNAVSMKPGTNPALSSITPTTSIGTFSNPNVTNINTPSNLDKTGNVVNAVSDLPKSQEPPPMAPPIASVPLPELPPQTDYNQFAINTPDVNAGLPEINYNNFGGYDPSKMVFSQGGNITNNSLNLRNTMRYKRFAQGGTFDQYGINYIPESAGLHHQSAYGGVPIGPNALAEGGEIKMDTGDGGQYIVSDQVDGAESQKDFTFSKGGKYKELNRTLADGMKQDLDRYTFGSLATSDRVKGDLRRPNDSYAQSTIDQIKEKWQQKTEFARQRSQQEQAIAQAEQQKKLIEEEYIAAYGGRINPKKYPGLNMSKKAKGGYVHNQMIQPMLATGGPVYGDPASPYTYAYGGMYGDPYYRGGQIDYTNDMYSSYASGGPMVGNAPQAFRGPAAQNRGGMLMTYPDGGMMPQDQQMMQEQQMQQQGGQEQMMQMVQQVAQAIMQGENPEQIMQQLMQSGMPQEQVQQIIQAAMQMAAQQQQQPQGQPMQQEQQMMPPQGMMARGGRMRYDGGGTFGPITEAQAIANGYQPSFQDEIDYTQIPDVDNLYAPNNLNRLNPNIGGMLSEVFKTSPQTNYPPELPNNQLADLSKLPSQQYTPFYFDVNANPGDETTMPDGTTFDGNVYNTQTPIDHYYSNQDVLTGFSNKYPGDTINTNNVNKNTDTPWTEEPWYSKAARYSQAIPGIAATITGMKNKKRTLSPTMMAAQKVNYEPERIVDRKESRRAYSAYADKARNMGNQGYANMKDALLNSNAALAGRISESVMREANTNAQLAQQADLTNVANRNQFKQLNEQMFQNAQTQALAGFGDTTSKLASAAGEERKQYLQEWIAKNRLGTRSYKTNINGQDVFVNADGQIYDAKTGTLLSAG